MQNLSARLARIEHALGRETVSELEMLEGRDSRLLATLGGLAGAAEDALRQGSIRHAERLAILAARLRELRDGAPGGRIAVETHEARLARLDGVR